MRKRSREDKIVDGVNYFLLFFVVLITLYPFYYILINSLNSGVDAIKGGIYFFPRVFTLENYTKFFSDRKWISATVVTVARTVVGTFLEVMFTAMVAYGLSYQKLMFRKVYTRLLVFAMYFSGGIIPFYVLLKSLHLLNTFWVYVIPTMLNIFFIFILVSAFQEIPAELIESARIDGAGEFRIFLRVVLPVSKPAIATMLLFSGVNHWNAWLDSAYYVRADHLRTLAFRMMEVINQSNIQGASAQVSMSAAQTTSLSIQLAAMMVATVPIMCVYPFLQKYFVKGMMLGSVKG